MTLAELVFQQNAPYKSEVRGAEVHKIDQETANAIAALIEREANIIGASEAYLAACICRESKFDPQCYNHNLTLIDREVTFEKTDWGECQFSGKYLPSKPGMRGLTQDQMREKAFDPSWAIPVFASEMGWNVIWATATLASGYHLPALKETVVRTAQGESRFGGRSAVDYTSDQVLAAIRASASQPDYGATSAMAALWLATMAYNSGEHGAIVDLFGPRKRIDHPNVVMSTYLLFEQLLGGASVESKPTTDSEPRSDASAQHDKGTAPTSDDKDVNEVGELEASEAEVIPDNPISPDREGWATPQHVLDEIERKKLDGSDR